MDLLKIPWFNRNDVGHIVSEVHQQMLEARETMRLQVSILAVKGAEQILRREVDAATHVGLLNQLKTEL